MTKAGKRPHYVEIVRVEEYTDQSTGVTTTSDVHVADAWVAIKATRGSQRFADQQRQGYAYYEVSMPYVDGITNGMYVIHRSRRLQITDASDPDERQFDLVLTCEERLAGAA